MLCNSRIWKCKRPFDEDDHGRKIATQPPATRLTLFLLVGGLSMLQAYWLPAELRLIHSLEILADELVYAGILVGLFKLPATTRFSKLKN
jgi:hypothetical protein